jgi:hypothetical protein
MKNSSCIIIKISKYITRNDITEKIIDFCNQNRLPLLTIPWEVHLIDIIQDYSRLLLLDSQREDYLSASFQSALYQTIIPENILRTLNQHGFPTNANYRMFVIQNLHETAMLTSSLNTYPIKYHLFYYNNLLTLIIHMNPKQISLTKIIEFICYYDGIILGVSDEFKSLTKLEQSYKRARFTFATAIFWNRPYVVFDELGIFQLLFANSDPLLLTNIYEKTLGVLEAYDMDHNTEYLTTLRYYLLSDCNLIETASSLYTHRNTIVYRLRKIKDLLGSELDNSAIKFDLLLAFYIKEYLSF